jgi:NADP-dependent alcohol dehydrogenase
VFFGIDHARTLAIITPSHYRYNFESKKAKLAQCAERVFGVTEGTTEDKAVACIAHFEKFFQSLGIQTKLSEYTTDYLGTAERIEARFIERGMLGLGERKAITPNDVRQIVSMSY